MDNKPVYTEVFIIPFEMMGHAIGRNRYNIEKSEAIEGVLSVSYEEQHNGYIFTVIGESKKAVNEARCLLQFRKIINKAFLVPKHFAGRVIGKSGHVIKDLIKNSSVKGIEIQNKKENAVVIFNIIGSPEAVQRAERMLNIKLDSIELIYKRFRRSYEVNADKKQFIYKFGGHSFKGKYNEHRTCRSQTQGKKAPKSKTPDEDCFVFFLENKMFRRIDYVKKQKQKQRALLKLGKVKLKKQDQSQSKLTKRDFAIDLLVGGIVQSNPSFKGKKQCKDQHYCSKSNTENEEIIIYIIETDLGPINLTKARFHDSCLGKYIEAAIKKRGLDGALKVATRTDFDDDRGTWISFESPEFLNEKGEICFECIENESNRRDEQNFIAHQQTKVRAKMINNLTETSDRKNPLTIERIRGKYIEAAIKTKGWNRALMVNSSSDREDYRGSCMNWDSPNNSNEKGDICFENCKENKSKREDEQSWWIKPQPTKDSWEEWDSDEESSINTEL